MSEALAAAVIHWAGAYLAAGLVFAVAFLLVGVQRVDAQARGASWGFGCLILPGVVLLWPLLARRWWQAHRRPA